jgi:hypothetical protein
MAFVSYSDPLFSLCWRDFGSEKNMFSARRVSTTNVQAGENEAASASTVMFSVSVIDPTRL